MSDRERIKSYKAKAIHTRRRLNAKLRGGKEGRPLMPPLPQAHCAATMVHIDPESARRDALFLVLTGFASLSPYACKIHWLCSSYDLQTRPNTMAARAAAPLCSTAALNCPNDTHFTCEVC